jgi:hypothetical protein
LPKAGLVTARRQSKLAAAEPGARAVLPDMKPFTSKLIILAAVAAAGPCVDAQSDLRDALKDSVGAHWIYDDFPQAQARAKQSGQPLLVVFRCVP